VGIDRVLAEADAAKASLYQHFGCKDQLVASYLERRTVDARSNIEAYLADTPPSQRAVKFFDWVVAWAESKDFRGCPLQHTVSELTDAAHPARVIAHGQREWFAERFLEWTKAAGVKDAKATARALMVLFDGAVAGSRGRRAATGERRSMASQEVVVRLNARSADAYGCVTVITTFPFLWPCSTYLNASAMRSSG
jgi:AcrR family transcriptional regulator